MLTKVAAPDPCDLPGGDKIPLCVAKDKVGDTVDKAADKVGTAIEFGKDPIGWIAQKEAEAAKDLTEQVIPALSRLTQPDLTKDWFYDAYQISFAAAVLGWVVILLWDLATVRQRGGSGQDVWESLTVYTPLFFGGATFGPLVGQFLVRGVGSLNAALADWGLSATADEIVKEFNPLVSEDPGKFLGGSFVAMLILGALVLALLLVLMVLVIMMVTLYLSGIVLPLSLMWATKVGQREKGRRVVMVWVGILCSQPLIFLLLGAAFSGVSESAMDILRNGDSMDPAESASLANLVQLIFIIVMLVMATLGPTSLASYAPVGPTDGQASGPSVNARGAGRSSGSVRGGAGASSPTASQTSQIAQRNAAERSSMGMGGGGGGTAAAAGTGGAAATGGTTLAATAAKDTAEGLAEKVQETKGKTDQASQDTQSGSTGGSGENDSQKSPSNGGSSASSGGGLTGSGSGNTARDGKGTPEQSGDSLGGSGASGSSGGSSGGRFKDDGGSSLDGLRGAAAKATQLTKRGVGMAQQAGDIAEEQMDHYRDGRRGRR